jgi:hypothetical protein
MEAGLMSFKRWRVKQNMTYTYSGIVLGPKEEGNSDICYNIDEPWVYYAMWKKQVRKRYILYDAKRCFE